MEVLLPVVHMGMGGDCCWLQGISACMACPREGDRWFYIRVVAEHVGLAVSYAAGFSLQSDGIKFQRLTVGLQLSSLEKPGLYEQTSKVGLNFTEVPTVFGLNTS